MESASPKNSETLLSHLVELRKCLSRAFIAVLIGFGASVYFSKDIYHFLSQPLIKVLPDQSHFITTHPFEAWVTYLKTALFTGLFLALPVVFWYIWKFIAPGLKKKERRYSILFVTFTFLLFIAGAVFGYFFVFSLCLPVFYRHHPGNRYCVPTSNEGLSQFYV